MTQELDGSGGHSGVARPAVPVISRGATRAKNHLPRMAAFHRAHRKRARMRAGGPSGRLFGGGGPLDVVDPQVTEVPFAGSEAAPQPRPFQWNRTADAGRPAPSGRPEPAASRCRRRAGDDAPGIRSGRRADRLARLTAIEDVLPAAEAKIVIVSHGRPRPYLKCGGVR